MKRIFAVVVFALANLVTAGYASAQIGGVQATVPFSFTVGNSSLPAGTYQITSVNPAVIMIRNKYKPNLSIMEMSIPNDSASETNHQLVFHKYGEQYFLSQVVCGDCQVSVHLPTSRREKRASLQEARLESPHQVLLALK